MRILIKPGSLKITIVAASHPKLCDLTGITSSAREYILDIPLFWVIYFVWPRAVGTQAKLEPTASGPTKYDSRDSDISGKYPSKPTALSRIIQLNILLYWAYILDTHSYFGYNVDIPSKMVAILPDNSLKCCTILVRIDPWKGVLLSSSFIIILTNSTRVYTSY